MSRSLLNVPERSSEVFGIALDSDNLFESVEERFLGLLGAFANILEISLFQKSLEALGEF